MDKIDSLSYNPEKGWCVLNTTEYPGEFEDSPKVVLNFAIENLFGFEIETFVLRLSQMGHKDIELVKSDGDIPSDAADAEIYQTNKNNIGGGLPRPEAGEAIQEKPKGGCCIIQ